MKMLLDVFVRILVIIGGSIVITFLILFFIYGWVEVEEVIVIDSKPAIIHGKYDGYVVLCCPAKGGETFKMFSNDRKKIKIGTKFAIPARQVEENQSKAREERLNGILSFANKDLRCR